MSVSELLSEISRFMDAGGYVMPPLMLLTLLLWFAIGYRFWVLRRGSSRSVRALIDRNRNGLKNPARGMIEFALEQGLVLKQRYPDNLRRQLDVAFYEFEKEGRQFAVLIKVIVSVAPLLGLLGTVTGMIETFDSLADMSLFSQSGGIAGGISQALFTTQMGLTVAIPGFLLKGVLDKRQHSLEMELAQMKDLLCANS